MRKVFRTTVRALAVLVGGVCLLVAGALLVANVGPGRNVVASLLGSLLGGDIRIEGLAGRFPDAPTAAHVEIRDARGPWLMLDHVVLKWSPLALLDNHVVVGSVTADRATVLRLPVPSQSHASTPRIDASQVKLAKLVLSRAVFGQAATLTALAQLHYVSPTEYSGTLRAIRQDASGSYYVRGSLNGDGLTGLADIRESARGLVATAIGLPGLGPISARAEAAGASRGNRLHVAIAAGPLRADADGPVDFGRRRFALSFRASAPAMSPRPDVSWQSIVLDGALSGAFATPNVNAKFAVAGLKAVRGSVGRITGEVEGRRGDIRLESNIADLRLPGYRPDLFSASPFQVEAHSNFAAEPHTFEIAISHRLLALSGHIVASDTGMRGAFALDLPMLAPFAEAVDIDAAGRGHVNAVVTLKPPETVLALNGTLRVDSGSSVVSRLLDRDTRFAALAGIEQGNIHVDSVRLESGAATASANGILRGDDCNFSWVLGLKDVSRLVSTLRGQLVLKGTLTGRSGGRNVAATGSGSIAARGFASGPLHLVLRADGLPDAPQGRLDVSGKLAGAPLVLAARLVRLRSGKLQGTVEKADWKSLHGAGSVVASSSFGAPSGNLQLHVGQLADLAPLMGDVPSGKLDARAAFFSVAGQARADVVLTAQTLRYQALSAGDVKIAGSIASPLTGPVVTLSINLGNVTGYGAAGSADGDVRGSPNALRVRFASKLQAPSGPALQMAGTATADALKKAVILERYTLTSAGHEAHLIAPAHFDLDHGIAVDTLRMGSGASELDVSGRFMPSLAASFHVENVDARLAKLLLPSLALRGSLSATGAVSGSPGEPEGHVAVTGKGLQLDVMGGSGLPPSEMSAVALLHKTSVTLNAVLHTGSKASLTVAGEAPLSSHGDLNLHVAGNEDLSLLDPIMNAAGRSVHGNLAMNGEVTGTLASPRMSGSGELLNGEFLDFVRGIRISAITARFDAGGDAIAIRNFSARAGNGTIAGNGSLDLGAPGQPFSLALQAKNAKPVSNDVLDAVLDADLNLRGGLSQGFALSGDLDVRHADVNIPDHLPPQAEVFSIRGRGTPPPPQPLPLALDLHIRSGGMIFIRGHGLDVVAGGQLHVGGTTIAPDVSGGFDLKRGNFSFAGQTLEFTSGRASFDGGSLRNRIDPALDFVAQSSSGGVSATLTVSGYASAPKLVLTSTPPLPQDEILARLLFQQSATQLSPWQLAQIGDALASLGNMGGLGDPLTRVRSSLGLDRLAVTSGGSTGTETVIEAGRYVAHDIYVGAKQGMAGNTQAVVQVDLTKHLKLQTQISNNNTPTPVTPGTVPVDTGSNIGLSYQFEY